MQKVYVFFTGTGTEQYLTASSAEKAVELVGKSYEFHKYHSLFETIVSIHAKGEWWLRNGITITGDNLLTKPQS